MAKLRHVLLFLFCLLFFNNESHALTISSDTQLNLGILASGSSLTINLTASDYVAANTSQLRWTINNSGINSGLKLSKSNGNSVTLSSTKLNKPGNSNGVFGVTVVVMDSDRTTRYLTFSGTLMEAPVIKTKKLSSATAGKKYNARLELSSGTLPVDLNLSGDIPSGFTLTEETSGTKRYFSITGTTEQAGEFPLIFSASNQAGSVSQDYVLTVEAVKPKVKFPSKFQKKYTVTLNKDLSIDLSRLEISGTQPISIDIDDASKTAGLYYDSESKCIFGKFTAIPKNEKHSVVVNVRNKYTEKTNKNVSFGITLLVKSPPFGLPESNSPESSSIVPYYATVGQKYKSKLTAQGGSKTIKWTWEFIEAGKINGYFVDDDNETTTDITRTEIKSLGKGRYSCNGLTFADNGAITGKALDTCTITFRAVAYNDVGEISSDVLTIECGEAPVLKPRNKQNIVVATSNDVAFCLNDYFNCHLPYDVVKTSSDGYTPKIYPLTEWKENGTNNLPADLNIISIDESGIINGYIRGTISPNVKAGKYKINIIAQNVYGSSKNSLTLEVKEYPEIDPNKKLEVSGDKSPLIAYLGKAYKLKLLTNTKKPYTWTLTHNGEVVTKSIGTSGLQWNASTATITGAKTGLTQGSYDITVTLSNDVGSDTKNYTLLIKPIPLEISSPNNFDSEGWLILKSATLGKNYKLQAKSKGGYGKITWAVQPVNLFEGPNLSNDFDIDIESFDYMPQGLKIDSSKGTLTIANNSIIEADVGTHKIKLIASDDLGQEVMKYSKITINGFKPKFRAKKYYGTVRIGTLSSCDMALTGCPLYDGRAKVTFTVDDNGKLGEDSIIASVGQIGFNITQEQYENLGKNSLKLSVTVTNDYGKDTATLEVTLNAQQNISQNRSPSAIKNNELEIVDEEIIEEIVDDIDEEIINDEESHENLKVINEQNIYSINETDSGFIAMNDYVVAAFLPLISVDVDGMYDLEVKLSNNTEAGKKLIWLACAVPSDSDDDIVEFSDVDGKEISVVPENRFINISVWLKKNKIYYPVIAVEK